MPLNIAQHDAWEQILSLAKSAELEDAGALAARYLVRGGYPHVVERIGIDVESADTSGDAPEAQPAAAPAASAAPTNDGHDEQHGGDHADENR